MQPISTIRPATDLDPAVGRALVSAALVAAGLGLALLSVQAPIEARLGSAGRTGLPFGVLILLLGVAAGSALLIAGSIRLTDTIGALGRSATRGSAIDRAVATLPTESHVVRGMVPGDGRPIPLLVIGPYGAAVIHEMEPGDRLRRVGHGWEAWTRDGWLPTEHPLDRAARDAERVRHWFAHGEMDFVVRVYAALAAADTTIPRSPNCAVIEAAQIPAWIAALPRQRSLSEGRRRFLVDRARASIGPLGRREA